MSPTTCTPLLNVRDGEASIAFYKDALGFSVINEFADDDDMHWATLENGSIRLMINQRQKSASPERIERETFQGVVFYFEMDSVHRFYRKMRERGFLVTEPEAMPYGVDECYLRDPDGYELAFISPTDLARNSAVED